MDKVETAHFRETFGRRATPVHGDNIEFSKQRRSARIAVRNGTATPEQRALLEETDQMIREVIDQRGGEND